jgi:hypothetical protein
VHRVILLDQTVEIERENSTQLKSQLSQRRKVLGSGQTLTMQNTDPQLLDSHREIQVCIHKSPTPPTKEEPEIRLPDDCPL